MSLYPGPDVFPSPSLYPGGAEQGVPPVWSGTPSADPYREAIRSGGFSLQYLVSASRGGVAVAGAQDLAPTGGSITDTTRPGVRRVLSLELAPEIGMFDRLAPTGTMLSVKARVTLLNQTSIDLPMGVFDIDTERVSEGGGSLSLTAPDKWVRVQRARFMGPQSSVRGRLVVLEIKALIQGALGANEPVSILSQSTEKVGAVVYEKDRDRAIIDLARDAGLWVYFDRLGVATVADVPTIGVSADWLIDSSASGVLIDLDRERSRTNTRNVVVVSSTASEGPKFPTQYLWDNDPASPTYAGPIGVGTTPPSASAAGPFGLVPYFHDTPLPLSAKGAIATGRTILSRTRGLASQISATSAPNPALDAFQVIDVLPPREQYDVARPLERHMVDTVTHPLSTGATQIDGRSTRSDEYAEAA